MRDKRERDREREREREKESERERERVRERESERGKEREGERMKGCVYSHINKMKIFQIVTVILFFYESSDVLGF